MKTTSFILLLLLLSGTGLKAQVFEIGVSGGAFLYSGDLSPREFGVYFAEAQPAFGGFARLALAPWISARLGIKSGKLHAMDSNEARGLNFRTDLAEGSLMAEIHPFHLGGPDEELQLIPYLAGGVGIFNFDPEGLLNNDWIALQPLGTEGQGLDGYDKPYRLTQINIPLGVGLRLAINQQYSIGLEFTGRKIFTDYLDDVSSVRVNYRDVLTGNGTVAARLSLPGQEPSGDADFIYRRGGPFADWYYFAGLNVGISFGGRKMHGTGSKGGCYLFD